MQQRRLFVALPLPPEICSPLISLQQAVPPTGLRWVPAENLHLTILFLGNVPEEALEPMVNKLTDVKGVAPFPMQLRPTITAVNKRGHTHMLWAEFESSVPFAQLCFRVAEALGHSLDREPHPHVTLARSPKTFKDRLNTTLFPRLEPLPFWVSYVELWESTLLPRGPVYQSLQRFYLDRAGA